MQRSLFAYVWTHSRRDQIVLLCLTVLTFPVLYATLELPKRIINDAIGDTSERHAMLGVEMGQITHLMVLCGLFLLAVIVWGLVKMRLNTMKGILRFPIPHFRRTSQGEMVSIVTSEAEPLGGIMGDALAQPVFQAGQMLTILGFLFVQSVWLGLTAIALIPLQAWIIPKLQRQVNLLNKERVQEVRRFSERIGETVAGAGDIRANGIWPYTMAHFTDGLGRLFDIRYRIYQKKYFMKFVNNLIAQLTPFFFFSIGGYLVIAGSLTLGALVAALAAYKDLSSPWKELLAYYNQSQDMTLRYQTIVEQFDPPGMLDAALVEGRPDTYPHLTGDIVFENVTVRDPDGGTVLDRLSLTIPAGSNVALTASTAAERAAIAQLMARMILPSSGRILVGGTDIATLHQGVIGARIGVADTKPYLFKGKLEDNTRLALRLAPRAGDPPDKALTDMLAEARRVGNTGERADLPWLDLETAEFADDDAIYEWWQQVTEVLDTDTLLYERGLEVTFPPTTHPRLAAGIVALRGEARRRLAAAELDASVHFFDSAAFNPGQAIGGNLLYAVSKGQLDPEELAEDPGFGAFLDRAGLRRETLELGADLLAVIAVTFVDTGGEHPLLRRMGLEPELFAWLARIDERRAAGGIDSLCALDSQLLCALPFCFRAEQIGAAFPPALKEKVLRIRRSHAIELDEWGVRHFSPIDPDGFIEGISVVENLFFGKICKDAGAGRARLQALAKDMLEEAGLRVAVAALIGDIPVTLGGSNLPSRTHEHIAFIRAVMRRPDIVVLDHVLTSREPGERVGIRTRLRGLLPNATILHLEPALEPRETFDDVFEIANGRLLGDAAEDEDEDPAQTDLSRKVAALGATSLFGGLSRPQLRVLAFASTWFEAPEGAYIFREGDEADGAYLLTTGVAELVWSDIGELDFDQRLVRPGRLIGDLSVIRNEARHLDLIAREPVKGLRIGAAELRDVIAHDPEIAASLLQTVSGYLIDTATQLRALMHEKREGGGR
jgi:putative ABC transport system ATP-binding protein